MVRAVASATLDTTASAATGVVAVMVVAPVPVLTDVIQAVLASVPRVVAVTRLPNVSVSSEGCTAVKSASTKVIVAPVIVTVSVRLPACSWRVRIHQAFLM